eukprot:4687756-Prymnesium_polylepis.1
MRRRCGQVVRGTRSHVGDEHSRGCAHGAALRRLLRGGGGPARAAPPPGAAWAGSRARACLPRPRARSAAAVARDRAMVEQGGADADAG